MNYELTYRRPELKQPNFTLLDESSLFKIPSTKRTKFVTQSQPQIFFHFQHPPAKIETLLGIFMLTSAKKLFWNHYVDWEWVAEDNEFFFRKRNLGLPRKMLTG